MNNRKQPIAPVLYTRCGDNKDDFKPAVDGVKTGYEVKFAGLTKREYIATQVLAGLSSNSLLGHINIIDRAIKLTDALLLELDKTK